MITSPNRGMSTGTLVSLNYWLWVSKKVIKKSKMLYFSIRINIWEKAMTHDHVFNHPPGTSLQAQVLAPP